MDSFATQEVILQHITLILSVVGLVLTLGVVVTWAAFPKVRSNILFMVLMLSIIGVIFSINHIMGVFAIKDALGTNKLDDNFCVFQGFLSSLIELAEAFWTSCMITHVLIIVHWHEKIRFRVECLIFGAITFGIPLIVASFSAGFGLYGIAEPHISCHFKSDKFDFGLHYAIIILCGLDIVLLIYYYCAIVPDLREQERILSGEDSKNSGKIKLPTKRPSIAREVGRILAIYVIAFIFVWGIPTLYRIYRIITGHRVTWLRYIYTICHNIDTIIYGVQNKVVRKVWKEWFLTKIWEKIKKKEKPRENTDGMIQIEELKLEN